MTMFGCMLPGTLVLFIGKALEICHGGRNIQGFICGDKHECGVFLRKKKILS